MLIKQVIIQGFKSYKDQTAVEPFSPGHNVVVGRNGSGKSNFFYAIRFVLSDFTNLRTEERQRLLHEGAGASVMSAYVELIFDNSDRRFPIDKDEVSLRRAIGLKKDEYFLNHKNAKKSEVMNLLESAGFSRSNPYYIVQQGKIQALTVAKDSERLQLLKEVAGTSVYEEKRKESLKIMEETESRRKKIEEVLSYIDERLAELESERDELKEYQNLDRDKRSLEYTIYDRELKENTEKLEMIGKKYATETEESLEVDKNLSKKRVAIEDAEEKLKSRKQEIDRLAKVKQQLETDREECIKRRTQLELDVGDSEQTAKNAETETIKLKNELKQVEKTIKDKQAELEKLLPKYQQRLEEQEQLEKDALIKERRLTDLRAKQGRTAMFKSKGERDAFLKKELSGVEKAVEAKKKEIAESKSVIHKLEADIKQLGADVQEYDQGVEARRHALDTFATEYNRKIKERDELQNQRKSLQRQQQDVDVEFSSGNENYSRAKRDLESTMSRDMAHGLDAVMKLVEENKINGVHGPLIELFEADVKVHTAVDVTAGNSLFNIVVDSDETVSRILSLMHKKKIAGRISFMPLNRLHAENHDFPTSGDAFPLLARLKYEPQFERAMKQVFGRTLVCRNMEVAAQFAHSLKLDCITLDGDQVSRKGAMTGGYREHHRSRLGAMEKLAQTREKLDRLEDKSEKLKTQLAELEQRITVVTGEVERLELKRKQDVETYKSFKEDRSQKAEELNSKRKTLESMRNALPNLESALEEMTEQRNNLKEELSSDMMSQLSSNEQREVQELEETVADLKKSSSAAADSRTELEILKNNLENELNSNLRVRQTELSQRLMDVGLENVDSLENSRRKLSEVQAEFESIKRRFDELETEFATAVKETGALEEEVEKQKGDLKKEEMDHEQRASQRQTMLKKRTQLLEKKEEMTRKIRDLGSLPQNAFERHSKENLKQLYKFLSQCNEKLKKYSHVNKKALDQYVSFSEQRDTLQRRKDDLDKSKKSIEELIEHLDHQKDEAIARTFGQVSKNFSDIFGRLTKSTNGKAELIIKTTADEDADDDEEQATQNSQARKDSYTGVGIRVSFTGKKDDVQLVQQLSGGQKSVVALALIFAIQRSDPAPFYLFDEIDSALDDTYRTAVAEMLHELTHDDAEPAQYITTTFHPEMLQKADKFYGITYKNKISYVSVISKEDAVRFVTENQQAEMAEYQQQQQAADQQQPSAIEDASAQGQKRRRN